MARHETDRENLMLEATALIRRAEWSIPSHSDPIVAGFKRSGGWSLYFGSDPVYQFDADGRLRRAFVDGQIWRTQGTTLAGLRRERQYLGLFAYLSNSHAAAASLLTLLVVS